MAVLCPRCELEPKNGVAGATCTVCGGRLVTVASGEPPDPLVGTTVDGRFAIVGRLGRGGMGTVYRARQLSIDREVALKMIDPVLEREPASVKRFLREAMLASKLAHPNIVSVIEFGQDTNGRLYLAMELVRGETLADFARREGSLAVPRLVAIGVQLCDALEAAHALGIVHRDLKLDNAMVLAGGRELIKVLDFGLARSVVDAAAPLTAAGMIAGTPRYLAPEVVMRAAEPAPAQDIYALGVMLGELASGRELWSAPTLEELFARKTEPLVLTGVTPSVAALVQRMVAADPTTRPAPGQIRATLLALAADAPAGPVGARGALATVATLDSSAPDMSLDLGPLRPSRVVALDERGEADTMPPPVTSAVGAGLDLPPGGPPPDAGASLQLPAAVVAADAPPLEVEREWSDARANKQAAVVASPHAPRRRSNAPIALLAGAVVIGGVIAVVALSHRTPAAAPPPPAPVTRAMVDVHIVAPEPVDVRIDGARAGKTPLTLHYKRGAAAVMVTATIDGHAVARQVTPDRDQTVDLGASSD